MSNFVKVEGTDFIRDTNNMSLINSNINEFEQYKQKRKMMIQTRQELDDLKEEISGVKSDISDIKNLLIQLIENKG